MGIRGGKEWLGELEDGAVVAVDGVVIENGPSGVGILVEGVVDFQGSLFEGGLGIDEGELFSGLALMVEVNFERGEDEVSTVAWKKTPKTAFSPVPPVFDSPRG